MLALVFLFTTESVEWFNPAEAERLFFQETNKARVGEGLDSLTYDSLLSKAARAHSEEMARLGYQSHTSPVEKNRTLEKRLVNAGVDTIGCRIGENIAKIGGHFPDDGFSDIAAYFFYKSVAEEAVDGLMTSPGHRENILRKEFTRLGVGVALRHDAKGFWIYFTQVFWGE